MRRTRRQWRTWLINNVVFPMTFPIHILLQFLIGDTSDDVTR